VGEREPLTAFVIGALAFAIACVAIFPPPAYAIGLGFLALAVAATAAWTGDRFFGGFTIVMTVVNWFLLHKAGIGRGPVFYLMFPMLLLPLAVMVAHSRSIFSDERPAVRPPPFVPNPQDFFGGLALLGLAIIAWRASRELPGQQGFAFGPGTAPRLFIALLSLNALAIIAVGVFASGGALDRFHIRGPLIVTAGVLVFAATIRTLGLIPSTFLLVLISSAASDEVKWVQTLIWGAILAAFCAFLFPYVLNLPMQLWPRF
jgi:putative tricarboxylic transport membrane protein